MLGGNNLSARERLKAAITVSLITLAFFATFLLIAWLTE